MWLVWGVVVFFFVNLAGVVFSVLVNSFSTEWFNGTWWPKGFTLEHWVNSWHMFGVYDVLKVTLEVSLSVVVIAALVGVPAAYVLARRQFPFKRLVMLVFLLPVMVPPIAYGIPLATVLYKYHLANSITGVIVANLVPAVPFVILTMTPFIEQIDPKVEAAARMCGAKTYQVFLRILMPLLVPGILAAAVLVLVRTVGMFELTYLVAGTDSETLVVALFNSMSAAGIRPQQQTDAMAVIYMATMLVLLVIALRFVNPTQLVTRVAEERES
ncbi:MAG: ABC transporter permease [Actinobacteria bacterium 13_2_20CM_2_71_6]|nr:MAG: ABC transporter permease [Actinobacteria bacterium 13_2_20CM_2_71_6]